VKGKPKKTHREKDMTDWYMSGNLDEDRIESQQRFSNRNKNAQQDKIIKTALLRAEEEAATPDIELLPVGQVVQVFSLYSEVVPLPATPSTPGSERSADAGSSSSPQTVLAVIRKTLAKLADTQTVVGDRVRFRQVTFPEPDSGVKPEAVIEQVQPRTTVVTRADSFKGIQQHPIVANADQMLIVASLREPRIKWGLIDRMLIAARAGGLKPLFCLNKLDLAKPDDKDLAEAREVLAYYETLGVATLQTSVDAKLGLDALRAALQDKTTVLAGHSGVGKSTLINAIEPTLDIRTGAISGYTGKGRHTTTSARHYPLTHGGALVDTPGVKLFGLWNVTPESLLNEYYPDVANNTAPEWRKESYERILESFKE
jgi:ribosome small subunit-dependent GTPase A